MPPRVLEYRSANYKPTASLSISSRPDLEMIAFERGTNGEFIRYPWATFVLPKGEDEVEVYDWRAYPTPPYNETRNHRTYKKEEINEANIISENGRLRITWRPSEPGDYPETVLIDNIQVPLLAPAMGK